MLEREVDLHFDHFRQVFEDLECGRQLRHAVHECHVLVILSIKTVGVDLHEQLMGSLCLLEALSHSLLQQINLRQLLFYPGEEVEDDLVCALR